jgi:anti-anti-sigma factor
LAPLSFCDNTSAAVAGVSARVVLNLEHVEFLDAVALGLFVGTHNRLKTAGRTLVIHTDVPWTLRLLDLVGLVSVLNIEIPAQRTPPRNIEVPDQPTRQA